MKKYDLAVIGSGPAGEKAAVKAAYFGYKVAIVEREKKFGGAGVNTGTLPSKTLKETALYFSGKYEKGLYGIDRDLDREATIDDFMYRKNYVMQSEEKEVHDNLIRHKVDIYKGVGCFDDPHTIRILGDKEEVIQADHIIIATGSYPFHPPETPFDTIRIHDSDTVLNITHLPRSLCIVGAGVIGCEYATIFATMGVKVYLINRQSGILSHIDPDLCSTLIELMRKEGIEILFNTAVSKMEVPKSEKEPIKISLETGETLNVDMYLFAAGRSGCTKDLRCEKAGLKIGKRECLEVNEKYRTNVPHIYAVGDVIGFPALAATGMDQGRVAVAHIFHTKDMQNLAQVIPYGIYTIPEVSTVGMTEEEAKKQGFETCFGKARYRDMPRGKIMGVQDGFLKIVFSKDDLVIRGVHIIGNLASELIHYGALLVENKKTLMQVIAAAFNYPTLHDLYKYACYDGLGNLSGHKIKL